MDTQALKFYKASTLPTACTLGDVYYIEKKGIYVCTKAAESDATEKDNYTKYSHLEAASTLAKGLVQLNDTVNSNSTTEAGTANAVKTAYDKGVAALKVTDTLATRISSLETAYTTALGKLSAAVDGIETLLASI